MPSINEAWLAALRGFLAPGTGQRGLLTRIDDFDGDGLPAESPTFRDRLDQLLHERGHPSADTTARTIFPFSHAAVVRSSSRQNLYDRYEAIIPHIREHRLNKSGVYFERMIMFPSYDTPPENRVNQIENILSYWTQNGRRKSAFQVCIYRPEGDWTRQPYAQFPCMQHLVFTPMDDELHVSAFYATQYLIKRGYGNYLGLCRLGAFMAHEMGLRMASLSCYAAHVPLESGLSKESLRLIITSFENA